MPRTTRFHGVHQFVATSQFFVYGKRHCTRTGWERHRRKYELPDLLEGDLDLSGRVFVITGANSGVGKEVARFLARRGGTIYMICRSAERAEAAREEIARDAGGSARLHVLLADLSLEGDVRQCWSEFLAHQDTTGSERRLDALVCNAGVLLNERTLSAEGVEVTFATHLLMGTYLLGCLAMPLLESTPESRIIAVSSGGMYNTAFPDWPIATSTGSSAYNGQLAYAYAKRGQVLLMERWAAEHPGVMFLTGHPGWSDTPGVEQAYGSQKKYLQPLRTAWQGAEGIIWLCVAPGSSLESGAFYLDRKPQTKHIAGAFFREGNFTKNSEAEVDEMMRRLGELAHEVISPAAMSAGPPSEPASATEDVVGCQDGSAQPASRCCFRHRKNEAADHGNPSDAQWREAAGA